MQTAPYRTSLKVDYDFTILPASSDKKEELSVYMNSLFTTISAIRKDHQNLPLWKALQERPESIYAQEMFRFLGEVDIPSLSIQAFRQDPKEMFGLFELLPSIKPFQSTSGGYYFMKLNVHMIRRFKVAGYIADEETYIKDYLKRIAHLHPIISEELINRAEYYFKVKSLINYAQLRVDKE